MLNSIEFVRSQDILTNFSKVAKQVFAGKTVLIARPKKQNIALISEKKLKELLALEEEKKFENKVKCAFKSAKQGNVVERSFSEFGF